ncbi:hypothetical protein LCGC14_1489710 [marine sediment metagenome]|uniref:Glycosyltransferase 2-like domain-containing protein n=1 Tax=marine sediment metagenome TaxID=412755 RepID=A0A0F9M8W9_9ZZZZ
MSISDLTVLTVVESDPGLLELMLRSVAKFTTPAPKVLICDNQNGGNNSRIKLACKNIDINVEIFENKPEFFGGSNRHGSGLNRIFKHVETKYTAIVESDVVVLSDDWHKIDPSCTVKASLKRNKEHLYHMCFFICETEKLWKNDKLINFMPGNRKGKKKLSSGQNYEFDNDVGWRLCNYVNQKYVDLVGFIDCKGHDAKIFKNLQSDEFHYDNNVIAAHLGRGSNLLSKAIRKGFKHPEDQLIEWKKKAEEILR